jgi:hypothetical protein
LVRPHCSCLLEQRQKSDAMLAPCMHADGLWSGKVGRCLYMASQQQPATSRRLTQHSHQCSSHHASSHNTYVIRLPAAACMVWGACSSCCCWHTGCCCYCAAFAERSLQCWQQAAETTAACWCLHRRVRSSAECSQGLLL